MKDYTLTLNNGFEKVIKGVADIDFNDATHIRIMSTTHIIVSVSRVETLLIEEIKEGQDAKV